MAEPMVRKQIYLPRRQNMALKRLAKERGVSEAEVVRQALNREAEAKATTVRQSAAAWAEIRQFVQARKQALSGKGQPIRWNRQELYEEREGRWSKSTGEK